MLRGTISSVFLLLSVYLYLLAGDSFDPFAASMELPEGFNPRFSGLTIPSLAK
jgi:hypothetical protein